MKLGIISDVHSNIQLLEAVLTSLESKQIDQLICLGDFVGYGHNPQETCRAVRDNCDIVISGNHEAAAAGRIPKDYVPEYSNDYVKSCLTEDSLAWIRDLSFSYTHNDLQFFHGTSTLNLECLGYVHTEQKARSLLETEPAGRLIFLGHTHIPVVFNGRVIEGEDLFKQPIPLGGNEKAVINVGSVGIGAQGRGTFATYETTNRVLTYHGVVAS